MFSVLGVGRRGETTFVLGVEVELMTVERAWVVCVVLEAAVAAAGRLFEGLGLPDATAAAWLIIRGVSSACWITFTPSGFAQADSRVRAL